MTDAAPDPPRLTALDRQTASCHGTAVAMSGEGLLIAGPPGAGKSGFAAQMIALGARLIADDLCLIRSVDPRPVIARPPDAPEAIELRGLGVVSQPVMAQAPLKALLILGPSTDRLPEPEYWTALGHPIPVWRHPYRFDAAAKALLCLTRS